MKCFQALSLFAFASLPIVSAAPSINATRLDTASLEAALSTASHAYKTFHGHREEFAGVIVDALDAANQGFNYIVSHGNHHYTFDGKKWSNWGHKKVDYFDGRHHFQYEIVIGGSGKFHQQGHKILVPDLNLQYKGNIIAVFNDQDGVTITFGKR